jgi:hypothetical protein
MRASRKSPATPALFRARSGLTDAQLDTPYRAGADRRQVAHHLPDSHMNAYMRFVRDHRGHAGHQAYEEKGLGANARTRAPIAFSLDLLTSLHER